MSKLKETIYEQFYAMLSGMAEHPENVSDEDKSKLDQLYSLLCKTVGISEHSQWRVFSEVFKWNDTKRKLAGLPYDDYACSVQNIIVDNGANELLKIISGNGGTPYNSANSYIYVGTDTTPESATDTGIKASGVNKAYAAMDTGYPVVSGRQAIYRASFGDTSANFAWNEASIVNGTGTNAIAMNRKVESLGVKATGTWTLQITISLTSA